MTLTAANQARIDTAMARRSVNVDGWGYTVAELLDAGRIAYVRENKAGKWGIVLHDDIEGIENSKHDTLAEAVYYSSFYDVAKMVAEYIYATEGIPAARIVDGEHVIERAAI